MKKNNQFGPQGNDVLEYFDAPAHPEIIRESENLKRDERELLADMNERVAAGQDLDEIMTFVFERTRAVYPCDRLSLAFVAQEGDRVSARWTRADYEPLRLKPGYTESFRGSSLEDVLLHGRLRVIYDLEAYGREHPDSVSTRLLLEEGVRSSMTCALYAADRPVALFFRSARQPRAYTDRHIKLHWAMAGRMAQAVEKAWRIEQLSEANRSYMEMLGFVSHELKGPLGNVLTGGRILLDGYIGDLSEKQRTFVERMVRNADYLTGLVKEYLDLARMEGGDLSLHAQAGIDIQTDLIEPSLALFEDDIRKKGVDLRVDVDDGMKGSGDPALLRIVLVNLIGNALKYGAEEKGEIRIAFQRDGGDAVLSVWNRGPGFSEEERHKLFKKFSRLSAPELASRKGSGVGLYTCRRILALHQGRMDARSAPGEWAEFIARWLQEDVKGI